MADKTSWETLPIITVPIDMLIWPDHDITEHGIREQLVHPNTNPIHIESLCTGHWYVHDGRHRILAAYYRGATTIKAHALDHWATTEEINTNTAEHPTPGEGEDNQPQDYGE